MPLWKNTQHSFAAGQLDTHVMGRQDMDKYAHGATLLKNFLVRRQGCISKRRGTDLTANLDGLLGTTYDGTPITPNKMRLVPVTNGDDGRYVILSGGIGFVASREGVLMTDGTHARRIETYTATDADGKPTVSALTDARASDKTPVDCIHTVSAGNYSVTRHQTLAAAIAAASAGDTIRLHGNIVLEPTRNAYNVLVDSPVTVDKSLTIDLYGYSITQYTHRAYICVAAPNIDLTVTSTRAGAHINTIADGNSYWLQFKPYTSGSSTSGTLTLAGDISWGMKGGGANYGIEVRYAAHVVINGGSYEYSDTYAGYMFHFINVGDVTINGGTFSIANAPESMIVSPNTASGDAKFILKHTQSTGTITINGGTFVNENSNSSNSYIIEGSATGPVLIYGGRFSSHSASTYFKEGTWSYDSGLHVSAGRIAIFRGEFAHDQIMDRYLQTNKSIALFGYYGNSTAAANATEITFTEAGVTATSGAWTLSDESSGLSFEWWTAYGKWHVYGTATGGAYINESVNGNPSDTSVTFPTTGITATRTWTFSDGGDWRIEYKSPSWSITQTALNDVQPNAAGYYGVKQGDEVDYTLGKQGALTPYRFAVPYADDDLADICIRQSGDTLFLAHRNYHPARIWFDEAGTAHFENLVIDNTDYFPPVIDEAVMQGNEPEETDWPSEFPYKNSSNNWVTSGVPAWLSSITDTVSLHGSTKTPLNHLKDFVDSCKALGTVTDAGYSGNDAASQDDGSYSRSCSYTCTSVAKDYSTGKKTTTVSVISFTSSRTIEKTTTFEDGTSTGCTTDNIDTVGVASNSASATIGIVTRTARYVATYVRDGKESRPSAPFPIDYDMPWANNAVVNLSVSKGRNDDEPDYYNIYKDNGNGYGLVGTIGVEASVGRHVANVDEYACYIPDNSADNVSIPCLIDYIDSKGVAGDATMRKVCSAANIRYTTSPAGDACLICPSSRQSSGLTFTFSVDARFKRLRVYLDGRIHDKANDTSYIIISAPTVKIWATYRNTSGESVNMQLRTGGSATENMYLVQTVPLSYTGGTGYTSNTYQGVYQDWLLLSRSTFTLPNGDTLYGHAVGHGDCAEYLNKYPRYLDFDLSWALDNADAFSSLESITMKFDGSLYSDWTGNSQTGVVRALRFYATSSNGDEGGNFQDDYINPDMTVTPPDDTQDAHFSAADEYPGCVGIYEQRLVFASTSSSPSTIWMSRIADLYNFTAHESIREDDALELTLAATEFPNINHLVMGRDLMLFGDGGEWLIAPVSGNALTYKTASAKLQSMIGSDRKLQPLQLADETLFAERGGTCLRSINYNYTSDSYQSNDLSVIAQSIFRANPIVSMAYKQHPDSIVECVLADGRIGTLVYMKEQEVAAWSVQELGGGWKAREIVTPKCIISGTTEMMILVEKDGVYQLWKVRDDNDELTDACQVVLDGLHVETSSEPTGTGEVGVALGDGTYAIGWPVVSEFVSVRPEPERGATAQMEIKNATESELRVIDASTFSVKPYAIDTGWREVALPVVRSGSGVTLAEKDCKRLLTGTNNRDGRIHVRHSEPWPLTILSISNTYQIEYENEEGKGDGQ